VTVNRRMFIVGVASG